MSKLLDLQQKRGKLAAQMRTLVDNVDEVKGMTTEQEDQWKTMDSDLNALDKQIENLEKMEEIEARLGEVPDPAKRPEPNANTNKKPFATAEYLNGFEQYVRGGVTTDVKAALTVGTDSEGGYTVPDSWEKELVAVLEDEVVMRELATVVTSTNDKKIPITVDNGTAGWIDEGGSYPESDIVFGIGAFEAWKLGRMLKVSEELLQDSGFNIQGEITRIFGETFGPAEEFGFVVGDGVKKPTGVTVMADVGKTAASSTAITYDDVVDLIHSVRSVYRKRASFLAKDSTVGMMRKLKSTDGIPLWQPSLQAGTPDSFLGYKFRTTEAMQEVASGNKSLAFGDFKKYRIVDRSGVFMQRLNEKYADTGQIGFRTRKRTEGKLLISEAIKTLRQA
ncbi:phage major capsid protein [Microbulbifer sp. ZKSA006]|uniref:phage major capsid protein n=1 Tax=Microbulbifer sp. ZKSA006 TaxID=3243390 RepID=UPI004039F109